MAELFVANHRQYRSQMLVVSDRALVDLANLVEGAVGEFDPVVADRKPAIGVVENGYIFADRRFGRLARLQDEDHFVVLPGQRLGEAALFLPGQRRRRGRHSRAMAGVGSSGSPAAWQSVHYNRR